MRYHQIGHQLGGSPIQHLLLATSHLAEAGSPDALQAHRGQGFTYLEVCGREASSTSASVTLKKMESGPMILRTVSNLDHPLVLDATVINPVLFCTRRHSSHCRSLKGAGKNCMGKMAWAPNNIRSKLLSQHPQAWWVCGSEEFFNSNSTSSFSSSCWLRAWEILGSKPCRVGEQSWQDIDNIIWKQDWFHIRPEVLAASSVALTILLALPPSDEFAQDPKKRNSKRGKAMVGTYGGNYRPKMISKMSWNKSKWIWYGPKTRQTTSMHAWMHKMHCQIIPCICLMQFYPPKHTVLWDVWNHCSNFEGSASSLWSVTVFCVWYPVFFR